MITPKVSIVTTNKNGAKFLRETIESIVAQDFTDYEHIIIDSESTDGSIEIMKEYPHLRWVSEPDESINDGFRKGFAMACGKYVMVMCVSDKYISNTWISRCLEILESDEEVSLVWGSALYMTESGDIDGVWFPWWLENEPLQKKDFFYFWLATAAYLPELNYCVRRDVYMKCYPPKVLGDYMSEENPFLMMVFYFNVSGYLPYYLRMFGHAGRIHAGQSSQRLSDMVDTSGKIYRKLVTGYALDLLMGRQKHYFRNGSSQIIGELSLLQRIFLPVAIAWAWLCFMTIRVVNVGRIKKALVSKMKL